MFSAAAQTTSASEPLLATAATFNPRTLSPAEEGDDGGCFSPRRLRLEALFHEARLDVIGLPEAKGRLSIVRRSDHYVMIAAAARRKPVLHTVITYSGCELWVHRRLQVISTSAEFRQLSRRCPDVPV